MGIFRNYVFFFVVLQRISFVVLFSSHNDYVILLVSDGGSRCCKLFDLISYLMSLTFQSIIEQRSNFDTYFSDICAWQIIGMAEKEMEYRVELFNK